MKTGFRAISWVLCLVLVSPFLIMTGCAGTESSLPVFAAAPEAPSSETGEADEPPLEEADEPPEEELTLDIVRSVRFDDVAETDRFSDAICYLAYREIFQGLGDGLFCPDDYVTCGQLAALLHRLSGDSEGKGPDDAIQWAVDAGVLQETASGSYDENARVTRAQLAAMVSFFARYSGLETDAADDGLARYPDAASVPDYARAPVSWAMEHGILSPIVVDSICPSLVVSRAQTAAVLTALVAELSAEPTAVQITDAAAQSAFVSVSRAEHEQIQDYVDSVGKRYGASGLQVAVVENGHVTDSFAYGWATRKADPMTTDHKMRVASISKVIIGMDAVRMAEDGLVELDAPIGTYWGVDFKNPYYPDRPVSVRGILTHTSSIVTLEAISAASYAAVKSRQQSAAGYHRGVPGSLNSWGYNNYAFSVLGMTLELAAGQTLDQTLEQYFYEVMDIDASFYAGDVQDASRLVTLVGHDGSVQRSIAAQKTLHAREPGSTGSAFAGGLTISANDLAKMAAVLSSGGEYEGLRMLKPESIATMESFEQQTVSGGFYQAQPLRYRTDIYDRDALYYHTGSAYGVYNCMSFDPASGDAVVVLSVGASAAQDKYGIYAVCGNISDYIYRTIKR